MTPDVDINPWQAAAGGLVALLGGLFYMRKKASEDGLEIAKNQMERDGLKADMAELKDLRAKDDLNVEKIARLTAQLKYLAREHKRLIDILQKRAKYLPTEVREAVETDFATFDSGGQG